MYFLNNKAMDYKPLMQSPKLNGLTPMPSVLFTLNTSVIW